MKTLEALVSRIGSWLQPLVLLAFRLAWGLSFVATGWGKLTHLDRTTQYFATLGLPLPQLNAVLAGGTECLGGLLLALGLFARIASVPLIFTMAVAYATAERAALLSLFSKPGDLLDSAPFPFLLTSLLVLAFGPGDLSLDRLRGKKDS